MDSWDVAEKRESLALNDYANSRTQVCVPCSQDWVRVQDNNNGIVYNTWGAPNQYRYR